MNSIWWFSQIWWRWPVIEWLFTDWAKPYTQTVQCTSPIQKLFHSIDCWYREGLFRISEHDRDSLRFVWVAEPFNVDSTIVHYRFTRLVFGLQPWSAILGAVISNHVQKYHDRYPELVHSLDQSLCWWLGYRCRYNRVWLVYLSCSQGIDVRRQLQSS